MVKDVQYIPDLAESLYSLFLHIQLPDHGFHSSYDNGLFITFPMFTTKAVLGTDDIYLDALPMMMISDYNSTVPIDSFRRNLKHFDNEVLKPSKSLDNLMKSLCIYNISVKTKCQLNLEIPMDLCQDNI